MRTAVLTSLAMIAFASNNLLTRGALGASLIDAPSFALIRLASGTVVLAVLLRFRAAGQASANGAGGTWTASLALAGYAVFFTLAYTLVGAGPGALLLFGAVQVTMIGTSMVRGERGGPRDWASLALAVGGLALLTLPGATAPAPAGAVSMAAAGACWGAYSLLGRAGRNPLADTAGNFRRATFLTALALAWLVRPDRLTTPGVLLAVVCGALASGVGYTIWYAALAGLSRWRASLVQLVVPVLTAAVAAALLDEVIGLRLAAATFLVVAGVWLGVATKSSSAPSNPSRAGR